MFRFLIVALALLAYPVAHAQSLPDPFKMGEYNGCSGPWNCNTGYADTGAKTLRNQTINTGIRNLVLIMAGQSLREAVAPTAFTPSNATAIDNLNPYDGAVYAWADPPLGSAYANNSIAGSGVGHIGGRIADSLIANSRFDRVILVPIAIGSSSVAQWASGGVLQNRLCAAYKRVVARGFGPQTNVTVAIEWGQGESDGAMSQANYTANLNSVISNVQACGFSGRFFVAVETWNGTAVVTAIQNAQAAVVNGTTVFASGNIDTIGCGSRLAADCIHLNDAGMATAAGLIVTAMHASGVPF
jgi:hypothetical protein